MSARRTVFVTHTAELGGAELGLLDIAPAFPNAWVCSFGDGPLTAALRARGVHVEVLSAAGAALRVRRHDGRLAAARAVPGALRMAASLARFARPGDILYANSQKAWLLSAVVAAATGRAAVWHLRDILSGEHFNPWLARMAVGAANRFAAAVIVNSTATGEAFAALGGRLDLVRVVHNGIDPAPFEAPEDSSAVRARLGLRDAPSVGLFGRLSPWKGQHVLLEALRELPRVRALVVGDALFGEDAYRLRLERLAEDARLGGRVRLLGFRPDVAALMRAVDIIVHTSVAPEPFGRVVVEGMLAQRPVIASAAGGVTEIIEDGVDGVLVPPGNAVALARAVDSLLRDPARAAKLAAAGHSRARNEFSVAAMLRKLQEVLAEVRGRA